MTSLTNRILNNRPVRVAMEKAIGISARRSLPCYAEERFDKWFVKHVVGSARRADRTPQRGVPHRGPVILWDDTFVRYHEPHIGTAAVTVLEALGFEVSLAKNRRCCGRPSFSQGNLDAAANVGKHNVELLSTHQYSSTPIVFLEPS